MTIEEFTAAFDAEDGPFSDEFLKHERIENPAHRCPDVCAFIMLDALVDETNALGTYSDMVSAAEHDQIWLRTSVEKLAAVATPEVVRDLIRCGVLFSEEQESLFMFA